MKKFQAVPVTDHLIQTGNMIVMDNECSKPCLFFLGNFPEIRFESIIAPDQIVNDVLDG
ncbi:MAG: hypothetical protein JSW56_01040 [Deltaproteobacteria bacterium]|nr:MAG: hypothetical protein JSW56_01040 [Deltaproteobacteria bacterium]